MKSLKEFKHFIESLHSESVDLWNDYNNRKDPKKGDEFTILENYIVETAIFDKVEYDDSFKNGTAFYYIFIDCSNNEKIYKIRSINYVEDISKLDNKDKQYLYAFWKKCKPKK